LGGQIGAKTALFAHFDILSLFVKAGGKMPF
jgi:hypothetical protein